MAKVSQFFVPICLIKECGHSMGYFRQSLPHFLDKISKQTQIIFTDCNSQEIAGKCCTLVFPTGFQAAMWLASYNMWMGLPLSYPRQCIWSYHKLIYKIHQNVLNWLYTCLESKVETEAKYNISRSLLLVLVMHQDQLATLGNTTVKNIFFIREHIVPFEQNAFFHRYIAIKHYDECTDSSKGGFGGMKYSGMMPVNIHHSVSQSACILSLSSNIKNTSREQKMVVRQKLL